MSITGYIISPALPAGITFDPGTGIISGTPTATSSATDYTVTAYAGGSGTAIVNLAVQMASMFMAYLQADALIPGEPKVRQLLSPNGDGNNDVLTIDNIEQYPDNKVIIMDVNGTKVYEASGYGNNSKVFDGHSSITHKLQLPGTYFYQLEYKSVAGVKRKTGFLLIKY